MLSFNPIECSIYFADSVQERDEDANLCEDVFIYACAIHEVAPDVAAEEIGSYRCQWANMQSQSSRGMNVIKPGDEKKASGSTG